MEFRSRVTVLVSFFAVIVNCGSGYETYIVERDCIHSGNLSIFMGSITSDSAIQLQATNYSDTYSLSMDCRIDVAAPSGNKIVVAIRKLGFRSTFGVCTDYIKIGKITKCENLVRHDEERHFTSDGPNMQMMYHVSKDGINNSTQTGYAGFVFIVTSVMTEEVCSSSSSEDYYRCRNRYCIWSGLRCDSHNNCGDLSDEEDCDQSGGSSTTVLLILGAIILLLLVIMCTATLLCSKNERVRRFSNRLRSRTISYMPRFSR